MLIDTKKALVSAFFIVLFFQSSLICPSAKAAVTTDICPTRQSHEPQYRGQIHSDTVKWVVDGDTIHTHQGHKLRLLHINTPELNPTKDIPPEPLALQAKQQLSVLAPVGSRVYWLTDKRISDKYHRQLALLFNEKGQFINAELAASGLAHSLFISPNYRFWRCIRGKEKQARAGGLGIWKLAHSTPLTAARVEPNRGFQLVSGKITMISDSKKNRWLTLDNGLMVAIPRQDFHQFAPSALVFKPGQQLTLRGYVYQSYGKKRMKWRHPAQLLDNLKQ